jgi:hypothetical protein
MTIKLKDVAYTKELIYSLWSLNLMGSDILGDLDVNATGIDNCNRNIDNSHRDIGAHFDYPN